jgi:hypothetical protein
MARNVGCPGAFFAAQQADDGKRRSSVFAAEGTLAHSIGEVCAQTGKPVSDFIGQTKSADGYNFEISEDFAEHTQTYVDVLTGFRAMGFVVALENRVSPQIHWDGLPPLSSLPIPKADGTVIPSEALHLFGTADCIAYHPASKRVVIIDLKFGAGIPVQVQDNPQLLYYGAGASPPSVLRAICAEAGETYNGVDTVELVVVQTREWHFDGPVRRAEYTADFVTDWARTTLYDAASTSVNDQGKTRTPGDHCRFCPALAHCAGPRELALASARSAFANAPITNTTTPTSAKAAATLPNVTLTNAELGDLLDKGSIFKPWFEALTTLAMDRLKAGTPVPGWSRAPTRSTRKWAEAEDADALVASLAATPFQTEEYMAPPKPLSPTQVERKVGAAAYRQHIAPLVVKNSSGVTLVSSGDPRARVKGRSAQEAFTFQRQKP